MKPVMQTTFHEHTGNCWAACLASILEIPLEEVPDLRGDGQFKNTETWLQTLGYSIMEIVLPKRLNLRDGQSLGLIGSGCVMLCGKSPRGEFDHAIVSDFREGKIHLHDPHPSGHFLDDIESVVILTKGKP